MELLVVVCVVEVDFELDLVVLVFPLSDGDEDLPVLVCTGAVVLCLELDEGEDFVKEDVFDGGALDII